ncbi:MAG: hypothetical protein U5Q03_18200 [Bacteroidota bacterium]|nr:hypothetical protein [Bacteroidota bacterium]
MEAPFVAAGIVVGGTVYGIVAVVGLGDCINNWSDDWGKRFYMNN